VTLSDADAAVDALFHPTALDPSPQDEYELYLSFPTVWDWWGKPTAYLEVAVPAGVMVDLAGNPNRASNVVAEILGA
jgi:hypothetical protein